MNQLFAGLFEQSTSQACLVDLTPPTFAGITGLVANSNGSLTASWSPASDATVPIRYEVYIQANTASGLFNPINITNINYDTQHTTFVDAADVPLNEGVTYYMGVRAIDAVGNMETNTVALNAISAGVPDNAILNAIYDLSAKVGTPANATVSADIAQVEANVLTRATQTSVDNLLTAVQSIQNNTTFSAIVPQDITPPDTGTETYSVFVTLYNTSGQLVDPDSNVMDISMEHADGTPVFGPVGMTRLSLGQYKYDLVIPAGQALGPYNFIFEWDLNSVPNIQYRVTKLVPEQGDLVALVQLVLTRLGVPSPDITTMLTALDGKLGTPVVTVSDDIAAVKANTSSLILTTTSVGVVIKPSEKADLVDKVWDEPIAGHLAAGTTGSDLHFSATSSLTPQDITDLADGVWNASKSTHNINDTMGHLVNQIDDLQANTDSMDTRLDTIEGDLIEIKQQNTDTQELIGAPVTGTVSGDIAELKSQGTTVVNKVTALPADPASQNAIASLINTVQSSVDALAVGLVAVKAKTDTMPSDPASQSAVIDAIPLPADVWNYVTRSLTEPVDTNTDLSDVVRLSDLATAQAEIVASLDFIESFMNVAVNRDTDILTFQAWLNENGQTVTDADTAVVDVYNSNGTLNFSIGPASPDSPQGVFKLTRANASTVIAKNQGYTAVITITRGLQTLRSIKSFTVV